MTFQVTVSGPDIAAEIFTALMTQTNEPDYEVLVEPGLYDWQQTQVFSFTDGKKRVVRCSDPNGRVQINLVPGTAITLMHGILELEFLDFDTNQPGRVFEVADWCSFTMRNVVLDGTNSAQLGWTVGVKTIGQGHGVVLTLAGVKMSHYAVGVWALQSSPLLSLLTVIGCGFRAVLGGVAAKNLTAATIADSRFDLCGWGCIVTTDEYHSVETHVVVRNNQFSDCFVGLRVSYEPAPSGPIPAAQVTVEANEFRNPASRSFPDPTISSVTCVTLEFQPPPPLSSPWIYAAVWTRRRDGVWPGRIPHARRPADQGRS